MTMRKMTTAVLAAFGMLVLILDGKTALAGASAGLELCLKTVIPSLFPFLFLCSILTDSLWGGTFPLLRFAGRKMGIPEGAESLLISAVLGGYPAGAQMVGECYRENRLSKQNAQHLLTFCSNAGPAFLFGMVALQFPGLNMVWALWIIQILSAFLTGCLGSSGNEFKTALPGKVMSISSHLTQSVKIIGIICGWVILFRILSEFLDRWIFWCLPHELRIIAIGLLELSNGCNILSEIENISLRFIICSLFLSFGGICVTIQTSSVIGDLSVRPYLIGKLTQSLISLVLSLLYLHLGWISIILTGFFTVFLLFRSEKSNGFPIQSRV